jgi:phosphoglycerate dehydrogenase-like enzyme
VVDEEALVESLKERRIAGAALDVFRTEPLPPSNPLWDLPNLLIGHNTATLSEKENERIVALLTLFKEDLGRYLEGEPLINRLDPELFYTASLRARGGAGMKYAASATRRRRSPTGPHTTEDIPPST